MRPYLGGYRDNYADDLSLLDNLYFGIGHGSANGFGWLGRRCECDTGGPRDDGTVPGSGLAHGSGSYAWGARRIWTDPDMPDLREANRGD